jgi:hypothetical protein
MDWIKYSEYNKPPQGLKILCFNKGDVWVCRRLHLKGKDYWLEIPYGGKHRAILTDEPKYWMKPDYPEGFTGYIGFKVGDELLTLDELQEREPEKHHYFVLHLITAAHSKPGNKWIDVNDLLPNVTCLVNIQADYDLSPFVGYLAANGKWYVNCPCCEDCEINGVRFWSDIDEED